MEGVVGAAVVVVVGLVLRWVRESVRPRSALRRAREGRPVTVHGRLQVEPIPDGLAPARRRARTAAHRAERAVLERVGGDVHIITPGRHWALPVRGLQEATGRTWIDEREGEQRWSIRLQAPGGGQGTLTITAAWQPVLAAVAGAPTGSAVSAGVMRPAGVTGGQQSRAHARPPLPRWATWTGGLAACFLGTWLFLLVRTTERVSPVLAVDGGNSACWVEWVEAGRTFRGAPSCDADPMPTVGEPISYLTTPWPVQGNAWDTELPAVLATLLALVVAVTLIRVLVALVAARGRSRDAVMVSVLGAAAGGHVAAPADSDELDLAGLIDRASADLGWDDVPEKHPGDVRPSWWLDVRRGWQGAPRWPLFVTVGASCVALSDDGAPTRLTWVAGGIAVLSLAWVLWRTASIVMGLRPTWDQPFTSEWAFRSVQDATGHWVLLLFLGATPHWSVAMPGRPPLRGTCLVRGDLEDGGSVHARIGADLWLPAGAVRRCDDELRTILRQDLCFQLAGDPDADLERLDRALRAGRGSDGSATGP
ncbi:MAG: hypothetical protein ACTHJJ_16810 [Intrasporangium sp.]|uniref:hypothetical protein n=1 Tax=Intrasporangium sp. TaxID=1925024 RepID=UPI003F8005E3